MELEKTLTFNIKNKSCEFRTIYESDVNQAYISGLKDQEKYIENIPDNVSIVSQKKYINETLRSKSDTICGLFLNSELVATAGVQLSFSKSFLQYIDVPIDKVATVGIFVFNKSYRGIGLGKVLVWAATHLFHECAQTEWFGAGMEKENVPSLKSFLACGFDQVYQNEKNQKVLLNISELKKPESITKEKIHNNEPRS